MYKVLSSKYLIFLKLSCMLLHPIIFGDTQSPFLSSDNFNDNGHSHIN